ncbi:MAG: hypothetical protein V4560_03630 [Bacteroidota bacterium]
MKNRNKVALCILLCTVAHYVSYSQDKKTIVALNGSAMFSRSGSIYNNGYGANGAVYFPISPSFNIGPELSYAHILSGLSTGPNHLDPVSVRMQLLYFPERLLSKNVKTSSTFLKGLYFNAGIGHSFSSSAFTDDILLNTASWGIGYLMPVKENAINIQLGINAFSPNSNFTDQQISRSGLYSITIGYSWITRNKN